MLTRQQQREYDELVKSGQPLGGGGRQGFRTQQFDPGSIERLQEELVDGPAARDSRARLICSCRAV
ncbi:MAG: hypothetical protein AB1445_10820 [Bacillota bacterium]